MSVRETPQLSENDYLINPNKCFCHKKLLCHRTYLKSSWEKYFEALQTGQIVPHVKTWTLCSPFDRTFYARGAGQKGPYQKPISEQRQGVAAHCVYCSSQGRSGSPLTQIGPGPNPAFVVYKRGNSCE